MRFWPGDEGAFIWAVYESSCLALQITTVVSKNTDLFLFQFYKEKSDMGIIVWFVLTPYEFDPDVSGDVSLPASSQGESICWHPQL